MVMFDIIYKGSAELLETGGEQKFKMKINVLSEIRTHAWQTSKANPAP